MGTGGEIVLKLEGYFFLKYLILVLLVEKEASSEFHPPSSPGKGTEVFPELDGNHHVSCCFH